MTGLGGSTTLHVLFALFGAFMLVRHGPRAVRLLRDGTSRAMGVVEVLNVVLAIAILAVAVKGLMGGLISR